MRILTYFGFKSLRILTFSAKSVANIIKLYDADFYELDPSGKTSMLFHAIPAQLNTQATRYQVGSVIEGGRTERLTLPLSILRESMTTNVAYHSNDPSAGLAMHINPNCFKLFCGDTGLFVTLAFWQHDSIDRFVQKYSSRIQQTYLVYSKDLRKEGALKCVPMYMTPLL